MFLQGALCIRWLSRVSTLFRLNAFGVTDIRKQKARVSRRMRGRICSITNDNVKIHSTFWRKGLKDQRTTIDVSVISARRKSRSFRRRSKMQDATFPSHLPPPAPCKFLWLKFCEGCGSVWRPQRGSPSSRRTTRISHEGFGTPLGPLARPLGQSMCCSTLSTTGRNCSHPAGSSTSSCSRPLKQSICHSAICLDYQRCPWRFRILFFISIFISWLKLQKDRWSLRLNSQVEF